MIFSSFFNKIEAEHSLAWRKALGLTFGLSVLLNGALWLLLSRALVNFDAIIPLHYDIYFGINALGPWYQLFVIPGLGLAVISLNFSLASFLFSRDKVLSYFLLWSSPVVNLILLLAELAIIFLLR